MMKNVFRRNGGKTVELRWPERADGSLVKGDDRLNSVCITNDEFCTNHDEFCIKPENFVF